MSSYNKESFNRLKDKIETIVIPSMFPSLILEQQEILSKCVFRVIIAILICFNYEDHEFHQFEQNNYQDVKWITYLLLPYLNEQHNNKITNFNDIYTSKHENCDINLNEPNYVHSNIQYNLFKRKPNNYSETQFTIEMLYQNYYLLINSVKYCANKMHTNWMDIVPYSLKNFKSSTLFQNTHNKIDQGLMTDWNPVDEFKLSVSTSEILEKSFSKITGLQMADIYNTMSIYLYEEIVSIKWLIFDVVGDNNIYPQVCILNEIFEIKKMIQDFPWDFLTFEEKTDFTNRWNVILEEAKNKNDLKLNLTNLKNDSLKSFLKSIIIFFNFQSNYVKLAEKEGYIKIIKTYDENDDEENISYSDILQSLESVPPKYIYEYLCDVLSSFKNTWYGTKMLNGEKTELLQPYKYPVSATVDNFTKQIPITYKNIYNFAKSYVNLIYIDKDKKSKLSRLPLNWISLSESDKVEIVNRTNNKHENYYSWFNIKNYIRKLGLREYVNLKTNEENVMLIHDIIYKNLRLNWATFVFEVLIMKGILTEFKPCPEKTDQNFVVRDDIYKLQKNIFRTTEDNEFWTSSYHYLTMKPYCNVGNFSIADFSAESNVYNYFTLSANKKYQWYTAYSYDWIAQIGFCHHFLNNRVIFITGATGVGKSTEIPKLFLYYSKALDYSIAPKMVCTQPRKAPTENNAGFVSTTLGVPIFEYDTTGKSFDTNNYYVQMKHRDREHISRKRASHPVLEYATDGSLILQINDVMGKVLKNDKYTTENIYDIIMIDEAHEHKINMDLLLTYLKSTILNNNSMRLVILSATMDEDEPKYRRYYRDICDNRKYPLNTWIEKNKLDRICIDRRFHISPPGMGTKYEVKDFYEPKETEISMVQRILKTSTEGDILIFQPGTNDINKLVSTLNSITPPNIIAIPYHSQLSTEKREFVEKISEKRIFLKMSKQDNFATTNIFEGSNKYDRIIIIATNVAEASITIPSLKFVIETGTQKVQLYDYVKRGEKLVKTYISESSRIQRRGRVGRKASGTVYYLYEKGKMSQNKIICEISTNNIALQLFGKLKEGNSEKLFLSETHNPNKYKSMLTSEILTQYTDNNLDKILKSQYFIKNEYFQYFGNEMFYDYEFCEQMPKYYQTGYDSETLSDIDGKFYIVHPDESLFERNINGEIIRKKTQNELSIVIDNKIIKSKKMESFWKTLIDYMYIKYVNEDNSNTKQIVKTDFGKNIIELFEKLKLEDHSMFRAMFFGFMTGCSESILRLYVIYQTLQYNPQNIFKLNENKKPNVNTTIYSEKTNDSLALLELLDQFHNFLISLNISTKINVSKYANYLYENTQYNYTREDYIELLGPPDNYSPSLKKKIISDNTKEIYKALQNAMEHIFNIEVSENKLKIITWCSRRNLEHSILLSYLQLYVKLRTDINKNMSQENLQFISSLKAKLRLNNLSQNINKITLSLLFGYPFNVCKKIYNSDYYVSAYVPSLNNMYQIGSSSIFKFRPIMLMDKIFVQNYVLYLTINIENNTISCLHQVTPELLILIDNIYSSQHFSDVALNYNYVQDKEKLSYDLITIVSDKTKTVNLQNAIVEITNTINLYTRDFINTKKNDFKTTDLLN